MKYVGIDVHTNRFTCAYRDDQSMLDQKKDREIKSFSIDAQDLQAFYQTIDEDTYVLLEATSTSFTFARLIIPLVKEVVIANPYELKQISCSNIKTDKIDADKLSRLIAMQVKSGVQMITPVTIPPEEIQDLRALFTTYRLYKKQMVQTKNRIHSLLKEHLYGFTQEAIFGKKSRKEIREISDNEVLKFQINLLMDQLEREEQDCERLKEQILLNAVPYSNEVDILCSMKGISVFLAIAIITDIIDIRRFKNSKVFTSYLRSAPGVSSSNTSTTITRTMKKGRKLSAVLLTQSLNHMLDANSKLDRWYTRLCKYKKAGLVRTGLRRRVLTEIFQMLKKQEYHYNRDKVNHTSKMSQYRTFLKRHDIFISFPVLSA